jgi:hypothetical protein
MRLFPKHFSAAAQWIWAWIAIKFIAFCPSLPGRGEPGGSSLSFASPKESNQRKGDPQSGPLRGSLKYRQETENLETCLLRSLRTSKFFSPSPADISSPARTGGENGFGYGLPCPQVPSVCAEERRFRRIRARACLSEASLHATPAEPSTASYPKRSEGSQTAGSPFLLLTLLLAKQKKSELLPGNPRQSTRANHLQTKRSLENSSLRQAK